MGQFERGQTVLVPCEVQPGPFPTERLVTVRVEMREIAGFVKTDFLVGPTPRAPLPRSGPAFVVARIEEATPDNITVTLPGSFFTTAAGRTAVSPSWANEHLQPPRDLHP